jgi:phospholipase D1/2
LLDSDFTIERPVRYYRQGLSFLHGAIENDDYEAEKKHTHTREIEPQLSKSQTIKRTFQSIGHSAGRTTPAGDKDKPSTQTNADARPQTRRGSLGATGSVRPREGLPVPDMTDMISSSESSSEEEDPTTAANQGPDKDKKKKGKRKTSLADVSQHTFYIQNSQNRLKLVAKNEVSRACLEWVHNIEFGNPFFSVRWCSGLCLWSVWRASLIGRARTGSIVSRRFD